MTKKVYIETMGCQMNKSDTERILGMLSHFGYEETEEPKEANLLIINTCSIRQLSADKAYSAVGVWGKWKNEEREKELAQKPFREIKIAFWNNPPEFPLKSKIKPFVSLSLFRAIINSLGVSIPIKLEILIYPISFVIFL